jgi:hypothetical protein
MKSLFTFIVLLFSISFFAQNPILSNNATVTLLTCGRGSELYSTFGHTALQINDSQNNINVVYNYGTFDFSTENFYLKFIKGDLQYFMTASSFDEFMYEYKYDNRSVIAQELSLSQLQKQKLFDALNKQLFSEDKYYTYKFIDRNCTTMVVDQLNNVLGKKLIHKVDDTSISYRKVLYPYFDDFFWFKLGINIIFGTRTDDAATQLFLPIELQNSLEKLTIDGKKLVLKEEVLNNQIEQKKGFSLFNSIYILFALVVLVFIKNKTFIKSVLFVLGLLGLFLCLVGLYSLHKEVLWNYNALLFNPLFLLLPFVKNKLIKTIVVICIVMLLMYVIIMISKPFLVLMLPFIFVVSFILLFFYKETKHTQKLAH